LELKPILGTAVGLGSLALVAHSAKLLKDNLKSKPIKIQNQGKNLVKGAVNISLGTVLLSSTSKIIGDL
jgi:hypothetical protein